MCEAFDAVLQTALKYDTDLRTAAYIVAIDRVAIATRMRGMYAEEQEAGARRQEREAGGQAFEAGFRMTPSCCLPFIFTTAGPSNRRWRT